MREVMVEMLMQFLKRMRTKHALVNYEIDKLETVLVTGLPVTKIIEVAKQHNAASIIMGSRSHRGLAYILIGSKD